MMPDQTTATRSLGASFWLGYTVTAVLLLALLVSLDMVDSRLLFWTFVCLAIGVFAPVGGLFSQAVHDLLIAWRARQVRFPEAALLLAICVGFCIAGYVSLHAVDSDRIPHITAVFVGMLILVYARRRRG